MAATVTTFGEWHDSDGDPWDADRGTFYPEFDHTATVAPAVALQSSLYPAALLVFVMSTPEVRLAVAPFAAHPLPGSEVPLHRHAFSGDLIDGNLPAVMRWTEECFGPVEAQALDAADVSAAWTAGTMAARLGPWRTQTASSPKQGEHFHHCMGM